jgi:hypothetical protein
MAYHGVIVEDSLETLEGAVHADLESARGGDHRAGARRGGFYAAPAELL